MRPVLGAAEAETGGAVSERVPWTLRRPRLEIVYRYSPRSAAVGVHCALTVSPEPAAECTTVPLGPRTSSDQVPAGRKRVENVTGPDRDAPLTTSRLVGVTWGSSSTGPCSSAT